MDQIQDSPKKQRPKISLAGCFQGCFGFSQSPRKVKENPRKNRLSFGTVSWFSWSKKSHKKTVLVDATSERLHKKKESFRMAKLSKKFSTGHLPGKTPVDRSVPPASQIPATTGGVEAVHGRLDKTKEEMNQKKTNIENGRSLNHSNSTTKEVVTYKKGIFRRNSWSQPTQPPEDKHDQVNRRVTTASTLLHSVSMPPAASGGSAATDEQESQRKNEAWAGNFDQLVGMSIIVVTLLIMMIWGKLCAILCTSAWLYFFPNILKATKSDHQPKHDMMITRNGAKSLDDSKKLKKKVVFEGFLERSHRTNN